MKTQTSLQFGIEIELLLGSRKKAHSSWKSLAKDVSTRLAAAGIANHINQGNDKAQDHYREWSVVQEVTIPSQPGQGLWGIELVSPVYPATWYWAADLEAIFAVLKQFFALAPSPHCSTHIHVSGTPLPLESAELAALAKAALYFEPALDALVPLNRRGSSAYWCQSNRANPSLKKLALQDCLAMVDAAVYSASGPSDPSDASSPSSSSSGSINGSGHGSDTVRAIVQMMNLFPAASAYGKCHGKKHDFIRGKVFKWDFTGMLPRPGATPARGTVEFRQAPGSMNAEEAKGWVVLALAFVAGTTGPAPWESSTEGGASVEELWEVLGAGAAVFGWQDLGAAEGVFARRVV